MIVNTNNIYRVEIVKIIFLQYNGKHEIEKKITGTNT